MRPCSLQMSQAGGEVNVFEWMQFTSLDTECEDVEMAHTAGQRVIFLSWTAGWIIGSLPPMCMILSKYSHPFL